MRGARLPFAAVLAATCWVLALSRSDNDVCHLPCHSYYAGATANDRQCRCGSPPTDGPCNASLARMSGGSLRAPRWIRCRNNDRSADPFWRPKRRRSKTAQSKSTSSHLSANQLPRTGGLHPPISHTFPSSLWIWMQTTFRWFASVTITSTAVGIYQRW